MNFSTLILLLNSTLIAQPGQQADPRATAVEFLQQIGAQFDASELKLGPAPALGDVEFRIVNSLHVDVRTRDGRVTSFRNDGRGAERSLGFRRDVALSMNTEDEARAKAQRLLADLGLDREFEIEEVRLEPETPDPDKPNRMKSWGTAHVQGRKIGDRPTFRGRNRWTVAYDRWDGAVLYYGLVDHLRFLEEGDTVGEAGARSAAAAVFAQIDAEDPSAFPAEWRRVSAVVFGWSSAGKQWIADYVARHGREPDFQAVVPAYKVSFSNSPWWPGWDEPSYVIVRASNGEILEIALS